MAQKITMADVERVFDEEKQLEKDLLAKREQFKEILAAFKADEEKALESTRIQLNTLALIQAKLDARMGVASDEATGIAPSVGQYQGKWRETINGRIDSAS